MKWGDISFDPTRKSLRQFAGAWLVFFLACGLHQSLVRGHRQLGLVMVVAAVVVGVLGLVRPPAIRWLFVALTVLAFPIGWVVTQVMLAVMFYGVITPVAVLFRLGGRDPLGRRPSPEKASYWTPKEMPEDPRRYLRQY
ncbi:MAG: SxtJ family membrane protein [Verrucomicrobiia bacterium]|jgi:hypothetical protein